jgi:hypothetical protein
MIDINDKRSAGEEKEETHPHISDIRHQTGKEFGPLFFGFVYDYGGKDHYHHKGDQKYVCWDTKGKDGLYLEIGIKMHTDINQEKGE